MNNWRFVVVLLLGAAVGYAAAGTGTNAQTEPFPVQTNETVTLDLLDDPSTPLCTVIAVRGGFLGCRGDRPFERTETWYNLRNVRRIQPGVRFGGG